MTQLAVNTETLNALAKFKAYAVGTLPILDLAGVFVFAISGAVAGLRERLDLFGVLVLSFAAASAGGIVRDLLIGAVPPAAISDWRYVSVSILAGFVVFYLYPRSERLPKLRNPIRIFDAAGLGLFAVVGTQKALAYGLHPTMAVLLGGLTGVGGGMLRDILIRQVPLVLQPTELYAVAALVGSAVVVVGQVLNLPPSMTAIAGAVICFAIRLFAIRRRWRLPVAQLSEEQVAGLQDDSSISPS